MTVNRRTRHKTLLPETNTIRRASVTLTLCLAALLWSCGQPDEAPPDTAVEEHAPAVQVSRESEPQLRQGYVHTEEAERAELARYAQTYATLDEWLARAEQIRQGVLDGAGLSPVPEKTPLQPIIHSRREYDGYAVENVAFESLPDVFVTGSLYRPTTGDGPSQSALRRPTSSTTAASGTAACGTRRSTSSTRWGRRSGTPTGSRSATRARPTHRTRATASRSTGRRDAWRHGSKERQPWEVDRANEIRVTDNFWDTDVIRIEHGDGGHWGGDTRLHDRLFRSPDAPDPLRQAAGFRDGAMAVLLGVAARKSARSGQPVRIASLTSLTPQAVRVRP